jgi:Alw26I/Eco31I/Esp3I family type II restriction m6 adenine DNA methyltransferase
MNEYLFDFDLPIDDVRTVPGTLDLEITPNFTNATNPVELLEQYSLMPEKWASTDITGNVSRQQAEGIYYTNFELAKGLVRALLEGTSTETLTFLEPCVGGGAFLFAYIEEKFSRHQNSAENLQTIIDNCFIADSDPLAVATLLKILPAYFFAKHGHKVHFKEQNVFVGDSLIAMSGENRQIRNLKKHFGVESGFDVIATNPPYKLLKKDKRNTPAAESKIDFYVESVRKSSDFRYQTGTLNLYKLFVEAIVERWAAPQARISLLIPRGLFTDIQSAKLRIQLLNAAKLTSLIFIPEGSKYFKSVGQAFSAVNLIRGETTRSVPFKIISSEDSLVIPKEVVPLDFFKNLGDSMAIHELSDQDTKFLNAITKARKIGEVPGLVNLRGELDMTLDKSFLTSTPTGLCLVQGASLSRYSLQATGVFVDESFIERSKGRWSKKWRIACQQISNANQEHRLKWALVPPSSVLANSCNFVALDMDLPKDDERKILLFLLGVLNSSILNKRFRMISPNNHISNAEISTLPIGELSGPLFEGIAREVAKRLSDPSLASDFAIEELVIQHLNMKSELVCK